MTQDVTRKEVVKAVQANPRINRQRHLYVYGDGPVDSDLGHPVGCQDVAVLSLAGGFCVVREEYLDALEGLIKSQGERLAQLEKDQ
jgi:hypothetical protein